MFGTIVASALSGLAGSALSQFLGRRNAEAAADYGADVSKSLASWKARNLPKLEREGLEAAGINPLSAYGSIGSGSMPTLSVDSSYTPRFDGIAEAVSRLPEMAAARDLKRQQILNLEADRSKVDAERDLLKAQTDEIRSRIPTNQERAASLADERKGVIGFMGSKITVPELWRKINSVEGFGSFVRPIWDAIRSPSKVVPFAPPAESESKFRPIDYFTGGLRQFPVFFVRREKNGKKSVYKSDSDASWIPGGSSARDMQRKRLKQF